MPSLRRLCQIDCAGLRNKGVSNRLLISPGTVKRQSRKGAAAGTTRRPLASFENAEANRLGICPYPHAYRHWGTPRWLHRLSVRPQSRALFESSHSSEKAWQSPSQMWERVDLQPRTAQRVITGPNRGCKPLPQGLQQAPGVSPGEIFCHAGAGTRPGADRGVIKKVFSGRFGRDCLGDSQSLFLTILRCLYWWNRFGSD